ncbi:MAG: NAD(P)H-hydrate dehydratase [Chloroflexi bacterium]|nr:NAD(P)H-hydrate dehydratase [Chloroflexota bacterium]
MVKVVSVEEMKAIEKATDAAGVSYAEMMQRAGGAVAEIVLRMVRDMPEARVLVLVGPGNNGGDGLVAARILAEQSDARVDAYLLKPREESDEVFTAARDAGVVISTADDDDGWQALRELAAGADIIVDALLGTGARLPIEGRLQELLEQVAASLQRDASGSDDWDEEGLIWPAHPVSAPARGPVVIAVDAPSGLNSDTGELDPATIPADITVTFAAAKYGQLTFPGASAVGQLVVADIGTPPDLAEMDSVQVELASGPGIARLLPDRPANAHKGTCGTVLAIAGSANYVGAVALLGEAAYRAGAGLVTLAVPASIYPMLASQLREATWILLPQDMGVISEDALRVLREEVGEGVNAVLVGPGLGQEEPTQDFIRALFQGGRQSRRSRIGFGLRTDSDEEPIERAFAVDAPLIIDADGLNNLARLDEWWKLLPKQTVLTPHPGEMARLTGMTTEEIQARRFEIAAEKAKEWGAVVVLKGAHTLVAHPDGRVVVSPFATDALATAGTGDVLAGCIAGLVAQGLEPFDAAVVGVYLHGLAGQLAAEGTSTRSTTAGDVLDMLPAALAMIETPGV